MSTTKDDEIVMDFFSGTGSTAHATMELNSEDGGNRKYIMVQLPEPTGEDSVAYKEGYPTIAEIAKEMNLGDERIRQIRKGAIKKLNKRCGKVLKTLL